jgi:hypothetical protein
MTTPPLTAPGTQDEIDAAHARYLAVVAERQTIIDRLDEIDWQEDTPLHDERESIDHDVMGAAENLLAVLGYAPAL